jgi:hypothetical protein
MTIGWLNDPETKKKLNGKKVKLERVAYVKW